MSESISSFVATLRQTGILDDRQVHELEQSVTAPDPRTLADELVRRAWLTPFQVDQLEKGQASGLVLGQYVLVDRIGEGGMGLVFKARHRLMQRIVALKVIKKDQLDSPQAIERFHREIRAVAKLAHPNVVLAHDADQVGDTHFFVMEYVEGIDLGKRVKQHGPLPVGQACDAIRQAALGLQHAHERGLVHRDIKPSNLLLTTTGVVKVLDLGLARLRQSDGELTETGAVMGTPDFMAPEQGSDPRNVDIRADLYSLGCTLFYLLAGRPVFPADTFTAKLYRHWNDEPEPVESLRPETPAAVSAIIGKLLAKKPADRYLTPAELAAALEPYCTTEPAERFDTAAPTAGRSAQPAEKKAGWQADSKTAPARSGKGMAFIAGVVALLAGVAGLAYFFTVSRDEPTQPAQVARVEEPASPPASPAKPQPVPDAPEPVIHVEEPPPVPAPRAAEPERMALLIGVGRYETGELAGLPYAEADLRQLGTALHVAGYRPDSVRTVGGQAPARALDIRRELHRLKQLTAGDSLIVMFAGQVVQFDGAPECYLCPADARLDDRQSLLALTEVYAALETCPAGFKLLIVDAFRAHAVADAAFSGPQRPVPPEQLTRPQPPDGVAVLWSCNAGEIAHDFPERKQSLLGYWLAEGIRTNVTNLESYLQRHVFASGFQHRRRGQTVVRQGVTGGTPPWSGLDSFTAPEPRGELAILTGHTDGVTGVAFAPDGLSALSSSMDSSVRQWDLEARREKRALDPDVVSVPWSVAFAADGKRAAIGTGGVKEDGRLKPGSPFHNTIRVWDAVAGREMKELQGHADYVIAVALSPDGTLAVSGSHDRTVRLWDIASGKEIACGRGHTDRVWSVAFSPDGRRIASASQDGSVRLWSLEGREIWCFSGHAGAVRSVAFAPDGRFLATAGEDGTIRLLEPRTGQELRRLTGHTGLVTSVVFAPDGRHLLSGGEDRTLRLWDTTTGREIERFNGHTSTVTGVAFGPDGRRALSGSLDGTVRLWALPTLSGELQ